MLSPAYESEHKPSFFASKYSYLTRRFASAVRVPSTPAGYSSTNASLPSASFWSKLGGKKGGPNDKALQQAQMALSRQRLVTLVYGEMETVRMVSPSPLFR